MSYAVVKNADGRVSLFVDGVLDVTGDDDEIDQRLWALYGPASSVPMQDPEPA